MTHNDDSRAENPKDPIEQAFANAGMKRRFSPGDLVRFDGRLYFVEAYHFEAERRGDFAGEEITYELEAVHARDQWDFDMACDDELELVADCAQASEWLRQNGGAVAPREAGFIMFEFTYGGGSKPLGKPKPSENDRRSAEKAEIARRKEYREWVDGRLDELNGATGEEHARVMREIRVRAAVYEAGGGVEAKSAKEGDE